MSNIITVITVCYNAELEIERTINSVLNQTYDKIEYIIVDGGSIDLTINIIDKYRSRISKIISEPDKGIYDAMNKGIRKANGDWVIMMNAGDIFASDYVIESIFSQEIPTDIEFIYSDMYQKKGRSWIQCPMNFSKGALNHQCVIYKKKLHNLIGYYIVTPKLIISDYLFFIQVPEKVVMKTDVIIAKYEGGGASSKFPARTFALCADVVFRRRTFANMLTCKFAQYIGDFFPLPLKYFFKRLMYK